VKLPAMVSVKSSNIQSLGWSAQAGLVVRFAGGGVYSYREAPKRVYDELVQSDSVGRAFQTHVRGKFAHTQHDDAEPHAG
jgi:hypothetical protein